MKRLIFCGIVLMSLFVFGCSDSPHAEPSYKDAGVFVSGDAVPTSFNESIKSIVKTDMGTFTVIGHVSGFKGDKVQLKITHRRTYLIINDGELHQVLGM